MKRRDYLRFMAAAGVALVLLSLAHGFGVHADWWWWGILSFGTALTVIAVGEL